jgi:heme exporter protein D
MELGPHATFIIAAYGAAFVIVAALIGWVIFERRQLERRLAELEARGVTRRSQRPQEQKA